MRTAKRIITASLTAIMIFQALAPSTEIFAQELDAAWNGSIAAAHSMNDAVEGAKAAVAQFAEDASNDDGADSADVPTPGDSSITGDEASDDAGQDGTEGDSAGDAQDGVDNGDKAEASTEDDAEGQDAEKAAPVAETDPAFNTIEELNTALADGNHGSATADSITFNDNVALLMISNTNPEAYKNARIVKGGSSGASFDLSKTAEGYPYEFKGFGGADADDSFEGGFDAGGATIKVARSFYNSVSLNDGNSTIALTWKGEIAEPIVANRITGNGLTLNATVALEDPNGDGKSGSAAVTSALLGSVAGDLTLNVTYSYPGENKGININSTENVGLLVNTLESGRLTVGSISGLDGANGTYSIKSTGNGSCAGGLIGEAQNGSSVTINSSVDLSKLTVAGKGASGGFIGKATNLALNFGDDAAIKPALKVGAADSVYSGGAIGKVSFSGAFTVTSKMFIFDDVVELGASKRAGGLFGMLDITNGDVNVQGGTYKSKLTAGYDIADKGSTQGSARGSYGGVVGAVSGTSASPIRALTVMENSDVQVALDLSHSDNQGKLAYVGGISGYIGDNSNSDVAGAKKPVAVVVDGAKVTCAGDAFAYTTNGKYGGIVGVLDTENVLDVRKFKLTTDGTSRLGVRSDASSGSLASGIAAGIAGSAWRGIIKLSGTTDLSEAAFASNDYAAQLVYQNYNSLIFAAGSGSDDLASPNDTNKWRYVRPSATKKLASVKDSPTYAQKIDDIHDYGEVVRLGNPLSSDLITLDPDTHILSHKNLAFESGVFRLTSADDFAMLAITWQSFGYFSMVNGVAWNSFTNLLTSTIAVDSAIDLSGTGLTGLTKDRVPPTGDERKQESGGLEEKDTPFKGTLQGNGSIKLATGEAYGICDGAKLLNDNNVVGDGKICRHGRVGLFAAVNGATIGNGVTISGFMRFDNKKEVTAGAVAALCQNGATLSGLSVDSKITYDVSDWDGTATVGGLIGAVEGAGELTFGSDQVTDQVALVSRIQEMCNSRIGGAVGYVSDSSTVVINVDNLAMKGSVSVPSYQRSSLVGGLVGYIAQGSSTKTVNIKHVSYDGFNMAVDAENTHSNSNYCRIGKTIGGLLGYSWGNTKVTFGDASNTGTDYALSTVNTKVAATNAVEAGGLIYAASGYWTLSDRAIDLSGATFSAAKADKFGLLVCRGGSAGSGYIGMDTLNGLYLKDAAYWGSAYLVNEDDGAIETDASVFDEWIADACRPDNNVDECGVNGVVSLHTDEVKLDMSSNPSKRNSYVNRTAYGRMHQQNSKTRYYYNLDRAAATTDAFDKKGTDYYWITKPEGLLLWSAWRYAPGAIQGYVLDGFNNDGGKIQGGTLRLDGTIDLDGYSYYPVDNGSSNVYLRGAIVFHYSTIEDEEEGNKKNSELSQHANMHVSIFRNFNSSDSSNITLTASRLTLSGTIGKDVFNGGYGALVSNAVTGNEDKKTIAGVTIQTLDGQDGVILDGLVVSGLNQIGNDAAPLLVNSMPKFASLRVNGLSVKQGSYQDGTKAATSLFGSLGGENADMVSANFSNIAVPALKSESIFTHASFLESFGYGVGKTGSGNYTFYKRERDADKVTYGNEIDANGKNNEYVGQQLWYYDQDLHGTPQGLVEDKDGHKADESTPAFGGYLPYVYRGKDGDTLHEIKVNQRVASLEAGCGTYGDPYVITSAAEIYAVSNYINSPSDLRDGWKVTITTDQSQLCTRRDGGDGEFEATYEYSQSQGTWIMVGDTTKTLSNSTMHYYLQSAYYSIEPQDSEDGTTSSKIQLKSSEFHGFGNASNPFRGVIVGDLKSGVSKTELEVDSVAGNPISGLIPYSYGSVIKGLKVSYTGENATIPYYGKDTDGVPKSFYGGVIGCILGGDNIIDGVTVNGDSFSVTASGDKSHLVPIGGYIGAIAGGGVIFRNMSETSWMSESVGAKAEAQLYVNPFIGRVIDGYAFSEGCKVDNGDKNYKVNQLIGKGNACVVTEDIFGKYYQDGTSSAITTKVENAQGLLVLSGIISSGSGGGSAYTDYGTVHTSARDDDTSFGTFAGSKAYQGRTTAASGTYLFGNDGLGKVRNADYSSVGKPADSNVSADFDIAKSDDQKAPGAQRADETMQGPLDNINSETEVNSPYLVKYYATWQTGYVCAAKASGMDLQFDTTQGTTFDMTDYGTGFTGLSGRYYSNACASGYGADRDRIVPLVACINGNGANIKLNSNVVQYLDDDYFLQSWGGLFSSVDFADKYASSSVSANAGSTVQNLTLIGDMGGTNDADKTSVSLKCIKADGKTADYGALSTAENVIKDSAGVPILSVGALAGSTTNREGAAVAGVYKNISIKYCAISGPSVVGGLLGNSGWGSRRTDDQRDYMIRFDLDNPSPVYLIDCSYSDSTMSGASRVGGFVGASGGGSPVGIWSTAKELVLASDSTVKSSGANAVVGGAFGLVWSTVSVNAPRSQGDNNEYGIAKSLNVNVLSATGTSSDSLCGIGGIVGNPKNGCTVNNVVVRSDSMPTDFNPTIIGAPSSTNSLKCAGGIAGQLDGNGQSRSWSFSNISVQNMLFQASVCNGGVVGQIRNGQQVACDGVDIENVTFQGGSGTWEGYSGGVVGAIAKTNNANASCLTVSNSVIRQTQYVGKYSGGISGDGRGMFRLSNVLIDKNGYSDVSTQGIILGMVDTDYDANGGQFRGVYASGIDVIPATKTEYGVESTADLPDIIRCRTDEIKKWANSRSYIAFANYADSMAKIDGANLYNDENDADGSMRAIDSSSPFVTTNPVSSIKVKASADSTEKSLFSDGVAIGTAETIQNEAGQSVLNRYTYNNIGGRNDAGEYQNTNAYSADTSARSTFNGNNTKAETYKGNDFPVLLIPGNDSTTIENYLNLVTNGGFSDARRLNGDQAYVTATTQMFRLSDNGTTFTRSDEDPSLRVVDNGKSSMLFRASTSWDNDESRFTLLTVTFNDGANHTYKVQVPIIVKRMLEIDFTATYTYGTQFNADNFAKLGESDAHVLTSAGEAMTGYLTWTYNSAKGVKSEYGWKSYLESGGAMGPLNKSIVFDGDGSKGTMPQGTQLTLVDTAHNNKEYHFTVGEGGASSVRLTDFADDQGHPYEEQWLSESMGVKAEQVDGADWVQLPEDATKDQLSKAVAKIDGKYYKRWDVGDAGDRYKLSVEQEDSSSENFYLVVRVPAGASSSVNGFTGTSVSTGVNTNINFIKRKSPVEVDGHQNTASTYSVASSFGQNLFDNKTQITAEGPRDATIEMVPDENMRYKQIQMDVTNTITFGENEYTDADSLFYQMDSSLVNYEKDGIVSAAGYPRGTTGTVTFYVMIGDHYYKWEDSSWQDKGASDEPIPATGSFAWTADSNDMSLGLKDGSGNYIDLKEIRTKAKDNKDGSGNSTFKIIMKADLEMTDAAAQAGISASKDQGAHTYTKPSYRSFLSPHVDTLSTSSMTAYISGGARYYRTSDDGSSKISLTASLTSQLGINVDDLKSADGTIALTGRYDFSDAKEGASKLAEAKTAKYTLTLQQRDGVDKDGHPIYEDVKVDISKFVTILGNDQGLVFDHSEGSSSYVCTDAKGQDGFATRDGDSLALVLGFRVKVNTSVETAGQYYSNYRLVLTARLYDESGNEIDKPVNAQNLTGYDNSDYVTYTLTRVKTTGVDHTK